MYQDRQYAVHSIIHRQPKKVWVYASINRCTNVEVLWQRKGNILEEKNMIFI